MMTNTLFQSLDAKQKLSEAAQTLSGTLDVMTSEIVGRLISERLIDYAGQPGQTIEYLSCVIADTLIKSLAHADSVEIKRFLKIERTPNEE